MSRFLTIVFCLVTCICVAQNKSVDSLQRVLKSLYNSDSKESKVLRTDILNELSEELWIIAQFDTSTICAKEALSIAEQIHYKKGIATAHYNLGIITRKQGDYDAAYNHSVTSLNIMKEIGDKNGQSLAYNNIGLLYAIKGNFPEAMKNYFNGLKSSDDSSDKNNILFLYMNIGNVYYAQDNYQEALKYYNQCKRYAKESGNLKCLAQLYVNMGGVFAHGQHDLSTALKYFDTALVQFKKIDDKIDIAVVNRDIGTLLTYQQKYEEALPYYSTALKMSEELGDLSGIASTSIGMGMALRSMQRIEEGKRYVLKALVLAKEIGDIASIQNAYEELSKADSVQGNFKEAYANYKQYILYRDSLKNEENIRNTTRQQMRYDFEKKEVQTKALSDAELKKQRLIRNVFMGGFALVLLFAGVFFRQRNKTRKEKIRAEEERKRSDELLCNILPEEVAEEIKHTGAVKAKAFTMVTVMFTDFKDFTTVSEKVSAELLVEEIHQCFSAFDTILQRYQIEKIKTIGDAYLCASGLPVSNYSHAVDMLNAAFEIRNFMLERKRQKELKGEIPFELRIGIHTGPVVAGVVGIKKYAYDIWGDTVNLAARMEQQSEPGKINISGTTYELVKDKFNCIHRGKIQAKNKGEIDMYFVEDKF